MKDDGEGSARWWRESLLLARLRARALPLGLGGAAVFTGACAPPGAAEIRPGATDAFGGTAWRAQLDELALRLAPADEALRPYYVPTLFQSIAGRGVPRARIEPVHTRQMDQDFGRGLALRELFEQADWPDDVAIVVDAPGPRAVAVAAALADRFDPVFTFANWPHPAGVVPADDTLGATLFFLPVFDRTKARRPDGAPPLFVLDSNRLNPYRDEDARFDNRYLVRLPSAGQLSALGVERVVYVDADGRLDAPDLREPFEDLARNGIEVRALALADFQPGEPVEATPGDPSIVVEGEDEPPALAGEIYWYGGTPEWHVRFWDDSGWGGPRHIVWAGPRCNRRGHVVGPPASPRTFVVARAAVHPVAVARGRSGSLGRSGGHGSAG